MELNNAPSLVFEGSDAERAFLIEQLEADLRGISVEQLEADLRGISVEQFRAMRLRHMLLASHDSEFVTLFSRQAKENRTKENRNPNARSL